MGSRSHVSRAFSLQVVVSPQVTLTLSYLPQVPAHCPRLFLDHIDCLYHPPGVYRPQPAIALKMVNVSQILYEEVLIPK